MKRAGRLLLIAIFSYATSVRAAPTPSTPPASTPPAGTPPKASAPAAPGGAPPGGLDFDLFGDQPKLSPTQESDRIRHALEIERKVKIRRKLLVAHQISGFTTLGLLALTMVLGTLSYVDKYGSGTDSGAYYTYHTVAAGLATTGFATTGVLALVAPNPYPKPIRADAALAHKILMILATAGFAAQIILGPIIASREGHLDQRPMALAHLLVGYGTFAFMGGGTLAFVFK